AFHIWPIGGKIRVIPPNFRKTVGSSGSHVSPARSRGGRQLVESQPESPPSAGDGQPQGDRTGSASERDPADTVGERPGIDAGRPVLRHLRQVDPGAVER